MLKSILYDVIKSDNNNEINNVYHVAEKFAREHYENFPVVSFLIPRELRKHVAIIYWFARTADDFADEGSTGKEEKINNLNDFETGFNNSLNGKINNTYFSALANTIQEKELTTGYFSDLLSAFKQDVVKKRYNNFEEMLNYCSRSANPVGRLILELIGIKNSEAFKYSDCICTALQLTNFLQDTKIDYEKGRIYLARDEMNDFSVSEKLFEQNKNSDNLMQLVRYNVQRIQEFFNEGRKLFPFLQGRLKFEIGWTVCGGEEILEQIKKNNYNVLNFRPKLSKIRLFKLVLKSFTMY